MLSSIKSFTLAKSICFHLWIIYFKLIHFYCINKQKLLLPLWCKFNTNLFPDSVTLIRYLASAVIVVLSKLCVALSPIPKTPSFLLSTYELIPAAKMITFYSSCRLTMKTVKKNPIQDHNHYIYIYSDRVFSFIALNKQLPKIYKICF